MCFVSGFYFINIYLLLELKFLRITISTHRASRIKYIHTQFHTITSTIQIASIYVNYARRWIHRFLPFGLIQNDKFTVAIIL